MKRKKKKYLSPCKSIRLHCRSCTNGSTKEIKLCSNKKCHLRPYRFGTNPNRSEVVPYSRRPKRKNIQSLLGKIFKIKQFKDRYKI